MIAAVPNLCGFMAGLGGKGQLGCASGRLMHIRMHAQFSEPWASAWTCACACMLAHCLYELSCMRVLASLLLGELSCACMWTPARHSHGPVLNKPWPGSELQLGGWGPLPYSLSGISCRSIQLVDRVSSIQSCKIRITLS